MGYNQAGRWLLLRKRIRAWFLKMYRANPNGAAQAFRKNEGQTKGAAPAAPFS